MKDKVLLIDGHSIANRAYFGLPPMTNTEGVHTNAILGFFNILFKTLEDEQPGSMAVAFDLSTPTFRHKMYKEYKGGRKPMEEALREQIPLIKKMLEEAGIPLISKEGYEADDVLGTIGKKHSQSGEDVVILSGDRDLLQLVDDHLTIRLPKTRKGGSEVEIYTPDKVKETYGVTPDGYLQMKALMGDASDNIPGVPKIGPKTAEKIITDYGTLENAIEHAGEIKPPTASKNLAEYADQARESLLLSTICTDVPDLPDAKPFNSLSFTSPEFVSSLKEYELQSLLKRVLQNSASGSNVHKAENESPLEVTDITSAKEAEAWLHNGKGPVSMAFLRDSEEAPVYAVSCACGNREMYWITEAGGEEDLIDALGSVLEDEERDKFVFNSKPLWKEMLKRGKTLKGSVLDESLAHYLLNATLGHYTPERIASAFLKREIKSEEEIRGVGAKQVSYQMADADEVRDYALSLAKVLLDAAPVLKQHLEEDGMTSLYEDIEYPLVSVLASMENEGVKVDVKVLDEIGSFLTGEIAKSQQEVYDLAGEAFNINSPKQLGTILFEKLHLPAGKKTKSGYSTSADELEKLMRYPEGRPIVTAVLRYRQLTKLESTYVEGLKPQIREDGRIHCQFQQTVTATGRLSCTDPNLQNIPIRDELGRELRKAFVPKEGCVFVDADYSQIELRLVAHMSGDENMIQAYQSGADIHRLTASQVLHIPYDEVTAKERSSAKAVNFGIIYGIGAFSLSQDLGISTGEAEAYIEHYFERFPKVKEFLDNAVESAKKTGYARTLYGRRRAIEELKSSKFALRSFGERVAKNMPIQGTAADIIKIAMIHVYDRLQRENLKSRILLQVHDELLLEVQEDELEEVKKLLKEEMEGAASLRVPLTADVEEGNSWFEAH